MGMRRLFALVLILATSAYGGVRSYVTGTLAGIDIKENVVPYPLPATDSERSTTIPISFGLIYQFNIQSDDLTYVAECFSRNKKSYAAGWVIHDPVQFRTDSNKLFLRHSNGKEMRLALIFKIRNQPGSQAVTGTQARQMIPECK